MTGHPDSVTSNPKYISISQAREMSAARARGAQQTFHRLTRLFILATALAAVAGGLVLYGIEVDPSTASQFLLKLVSNESVQPVLFAIQGACLGVAAFCTYLLTARNYNKVWTQSRMAAEEGRLDLQRAALEIAHAANADDFRLAGRAFIAFVEGQMQYLTNRSEKHDQSAFVLAFAGACLAGVASLAAVLGGMDSKTVFALLALLGVCAPALVAALKSWSESSADAYRAELHHRTWLALNTLRADQAKFDAAVEGNDLETAMEYVNQVFGALREDHVGFAEKRQAAAQ